MAKEPQDITQAEIYRLRAETLREANEQRSHMAALKDHASFLALKKYLQAQVEQRMNELLVMPKNSDDLIHKTYSMGEMAGIKLAMDMPEVLLDYAKSSIASVISAQENEKEQEYGESTDDTEASGFDDDES